MPEESVRVARCDGGFAERKTYAGKELGVVVDTEFAVFAEIASPRTTVPTRLMQDPIWLIPSTLPTVQQPLTAFLAAQTA